MDFEFGPEAQARAERVTAFFEAEVLPRHREWFRTVVEEGGEASFIRDLQARARAHGLWNLALPDLAEDEPGTRLSNLEFAPLAEIMGRLPWGSEPFNCQAPDVPNMVMLHNVATPEQKRLWLDPLLRAETRSAFALTEPGVASSDATNIAATIERDGDGYVVNGSKWYSTGAAHPRCSFLIVVGVTNPDAERTWRHSAVVVPTSAPGVTVTRSLRFLGWEDHVAPIGEITFENVRIPREHLLGREGDGFRISQTRLGPARVHHCMRLIGISEVLVSLMQARARERRTFGRTISEYDTVQRWVAESRVEIEQARLLVYRTAWALDRHGFRGAWRDVSLSKLAVPAMAQRIADRAVQLFGAMGGSDDVPIHHAYAYARLMRIGDGPDEVHYRQIAKLEPVPGWALADSPYVTRPVAGAQVKATSVRPAVSPETCRSQ